MFTITQERQISVTVRRTCLYSCPQTRKCLLNHHVSPTLTSVTQMHNPSLGTRAWVWLLRRGGINSHSDTHSACQQHASPSSNMMHRCCARCCAPSGCTGQRCKPASKACSASCWRDDSSTILVDEPTRQQCAGRVLATEAAATLSRRGGTIKRPLWRCHVSE